MIAHYSFFPLKMRAFSVLLTPIHTYGIFLQPYCINGSLRTQKRKYSINTAQNMQFFIKDSLSKCDQIRSFKEIWSHLLKKSVMKLSFLCIVIWQNNLFLAYIRLVHYLTRKILKSNSLLQNICMFLQKETLNCRDSSTLFPRGPKYYIFGCHFYSKNARKFRQHLSLQFHAKHYMIL